MKKLFLSLALMATLLFTACQKEEMNPNAQGASQVTFSVEIPDIAQTRANGNEPTIQQIENGALINDLVYAVYRIDPLVTEESDAIASIADAEPMYEINPKAHAFDGGKTNVTIELMNDQNYVILFWAQNDDKWTGEGLGFDLTDMTYPTNLKANDASLAAFSGVSFIKNVDGPRSEPVTLTRPFAQINIGTLQPDKFKVQFEKSNLKVIGASTSFNVATQNASSDVTTVEAPLVFAENNVPGNNEKIDVNGTYYDYVAMNYIFAKAKNSVEVVFDIATKDHGTVNTTIPNVPVAKNYKTNIVGNLLTSDVTYRVELIDSWSTPDKVVLVGDATGLQSAIDNAQEGETTEIKLGGDINLSDLFNILTRANDEQDKPTSITIPAGKNVVLDLNGYKITDVDENNTSSYATIKSNGNLTIKNTSLTPASITLKAVNDRDWNAYSSVISNNPDGVLTVESNVTIEHLGGTDMAYGIDNLTNGKGTSAVTVIDGATIKSTYRAIRQFLNGIEANNSLTVNDGSKIYGTNKSIWMQDPSANANTGTLTVNTGAELYGDVYLSVTAGSTEWPVKASIPTSTLKNGSTVLTSNVPARYQLEEVNGIWTVNFYPVAKIGEKGYATLSAAVSAVQDGGTITLVDNETFTESNRYNNGGWWDGLGYSGDKSFTIDLDGHTISQDGALNDYLMWFKNDGAKANTITLKNGTLDAGTTAFSAFATASSNAQKITVNFENINLINNISNGAVLKIRGGAEANVKAGTIITGKNSYTGIEAVGNNTVVNIYEGAEIYQKGTSNYVGAIVGASYNATMNIYGGYGKSAKCGIIVMSTGATINVSGGEWIANNDGTVAGDNNAVLVSQNNRYESGWACKSVLNVTGGTFKGGYNCYGMGPGVEADDAQINIKGGNFNADPAAYVVNGYTVTESTTGNYKVGPFEVSSLSDLKEALDNGNNVTLMNDIAISKEDAGSNGYGATGISQLKGGVIDGNGKNISVNAWATWDSAINTTGGTIKNLNVTGGMRGIFINHNSTYSDKVILDNVTIDGTIYTISCDQGTNKGLEATNCTFKGWTSYAATIGDVKFTDCNFGKGQGYAFCQPYAPTSFENCSFESGFGLNPMATVTFKNCTIGGVALTADNLSTLVTGNINNASVISE